MKTFAIRDDEENKSKNLAYLIYFESDKSAYIELPDNPDPLQTPLLLSSFAKRGKTTINKYYSKIWIQQRIVPMDRQNIGQILKDNGLKEYDEFELLMLANGRCAQDSYYIAPIDESIVFDIFKNRYDKKVEDVIPLDNNTLLVFFRNGEIKKCNIGHIRCEDRFFKPVLSDSNIFEKVTILSGGYGVAWSKDATIDDFELYECGESIPLSTDDFIKFFSNRIVSTSEAAEILECSRQNINDLVVRDKLHPVKVEVKNKYFLKSEIMHRLWG